MPAGRPPFYKTPEELQEKIDQYFETGVATREAFVKDRVVTIKVPTITGLVLFCGFADRISFYTYGEKPEFSNTIKNARTRIEQCYEEQLAVNGGSGAIFALKNFGWTDQQTIIHGESNPDDEFL